MDRIEQVPRWLWAIPIGVAALRMLPWLATFAIAAPAGETLLHVGFIPKDTLQYLAFAHEAGENASLFVANPFTTEPQDGRFLLPLMAAIGWFASATSTPAIAWLELARVPLLCLWLAALWRLLGDFFPDRRERTIASVLVALSGGIEVLAKPLAGWLPPELGVALEQATWQMSGWSLFAAAANPLWIAGGAGALVLLRPLLATSGAVSPGQCAAIASGWLGLFALHPYSALAVGTIALAQPLVRLAAGVELDRERWLRIGLTLAAGAAGIAALSAWQRADPVFASVASSVLGTQQLSPFWYPLVLGGLCVLALRGARIWAAGTHPLRFALLAWLLAAVFLHTSTLLNGYHFAAQLHVPLCILAAPAFFETWRRARERRLGARVLCAVTFAAPLLLTIESIALLRTTHAVPVEYPALVESLRDRPAGAVLSGARLGNILPAYTHHRVYVGHHFLTPDFPSRRREVIDRTAGDVDAAALQRFVARHDFRYAVLPNERGAAIAALATRAGRVDVIGRFTVLELD